LIWIKISNLDFSTGRFTVLSNVCHYTLTIRKQLAVDRSTILASLAIGFFCVIFASRPDLAIRLIKRANPRQGQSPRTPTAEKSNFTLTHTYNNGALLHELLLVRRISPFKLVKTVSSCFLSYQQYPKPLLLPLGSGSYPPQMRSIRVATIGDEYQQRML
jgi:hypothetical protein